MARRRRIPTEDRVERMAEALRRVDWGDDVALSEVVEAWRSLAALHHPAPKS